MKNENEIKATNILKAIAIWFVIINHVNWITTFDTRHFYFWVYAAVPVFAVITGYHYARSISIGTEKNDCIDNSNFFSGIGFDRIDSFWFNRRRSGNRLLKVLIPYILMFIVYMAYQRVTRGNFLTGGLSATLAIFLRGGAGPGGYYTPVIIQFLVVFHFSIIRLKGIRYRELF